MTIFFYSLAFVLLIISSVKSKGKTKSALKIAWKSFESIIDCVYVIGSLCSVIDSLRSMKWSTAYPLTFPTQFRKPFLINSLGTLAYKLKVFSTISNKTTSSSTLIFPPFNTLVKIPFVGIIHCPT